MTRENLIQEVANKTLISKKDIQFILETTFNTISESTKTEMVTIKINDKIITITI